MNTVTKTISFSCLLALTVTAVPALSRSALINEKDAYAADDDSTEVDPFIFEFCASTETN